MRHANSKITLDVYAQGDEVAKRARKNMSAACSFSKRRAEHPPETQSPPANGGLYISVDCRRRSTLLFISAFSVP
jgi:hypothetical protein